MGLTVAVTGPTGEIGISALTALEREPTVEKIVAMARRPFDPSMYGWTKTTYQQGNIMDPGAVDALGAQADALGAQADVVIHLAFLLTGPRAESARINLQGGRNVFEATVAARRPGRLVYTSSVAAYGYFAENPLPLAEEVPARGSSEHYCSEQKAALEAVLAEVTEGSSLEAFVLRPCIVAGPDAHALADAMPWNQLPAPVRALAKAVPGLRRVVPDPGFPLQLVHHDDVAVAIALAATAPAPPGAYNIAADGVVTVTDVAKALGGRPVSVPAPAGAAASATISRLPCVPPRLEWLHAARTSVVMDTTKAKRHLGWRPTHSSAETLAALASAV
ncbi:MAG: NAD-dependent epimerase/dehydratase family protein [Mycobacterium sp.]